MRECKSYRVFCHKKICERHNCKIKLFIRGLGRIGFMEYYYYYNVRFYVKIKICVVSSHTLSSVKVLFLLPTLFRKMLCFTLFPDVV